jgi:hypothetical protein
MSETTNARLMGAIGTEVSEVRAGLDDLAGLMGSLIFQLPPEVRQDALTQAQAFDALSQSLDAIAGLIGDLSRGVAPETALEALTLSDLAARLRGREAVPSSNAVSGDLMLFD